MRLLVPDPPPPWDRSKDGSGGGGGGGAGGNGNASGRHRRAAPPSSGDPSPGEERGIREPPGKANRSPPHICRLDPREEAKVRPLVRNLAAGRRHQSLELKTKTQELKTMTAELKPKSPKLKTKTH